MLAKLSGIRLRRHLHPQADMATDRHTRMDSLWRQGPQPDRAMAPLCLQASLPAPRMDRNQWISQAL